jgi:hypothetical protein
VVKKRNIYIGVPPYRSYNKPIGLNGWSNMVLIDFSDNVKRSFKKMKSEIEGLKSSTNEWILFLNGNQRDLKVRVYELERKFKQIEMREQKVFR